MKSMIKWTLSKQNVIKINLMNLLIISAIILGFNVRSVYAQGDGYWKFVRVEQEPRDTRYDVDMNLVGDIGNILITHYGRNSISKTDGPPWREDQTMSARFVWEKPADILMAGSLIRFTFSCMVTINSHPNEGLSLGSGAIAWFGWNYSETSTFKHESNPEKYILTYNVFENSGAATNLNINKGQMFLYGQYRIPETPNNYRDENGKKITALTFKINPGTAAPLVYRYIYEWHEGKPPKLTGSDSKIENPLSGKWYISNDGNYWIFEPLDDKTFVATKSGKSEEKGIAILDGNRLILLFISQDLSRSGIFNLQISDDKNIISGTYTESPMAGRFIELIRKE